MEVCLGVGKSTVTRGREEGSVELSLSVSGHTPGGRGLGVGIPGRGSSMGTSPEAQNILHLENVIKRDLIYSEGIWGDFPVSA